MYERGMLSIADNAAREAEYERDNYNKEGRSPVYDASEGDAYLPHSCDQWVIGGPDEVRVLIADLEEYLVGGVGKEPA